MLLKDMRMDEWKELILSTGKQKEEEKREALGKNRQNNGLFWKAAVFPENQEYTRNET